MKVLQVEGEIYQDERIQDGPWKWDTDVIAEIVSKYVEEKGIQSVDIRTIKVREHPLIRSCRSLHLIILAYLHIPITYPCTKRYHQSEKHAREKFTHMLWKQSPYFENTYLYWTILRLVFDGGSEVRFRARLLEALFI